MCTGYESTTVSDMTRMAWNHNLIVILLFYNFYNMIIITIMTHDVYYRRVRDEFTSADNINRSIESLISGYKIGI